MQKENIVIVGAGPSGVAAAVQCKRLGVPPLLLEATGRAGGLAENAFFIENYPCTKPVDGPSFVGGLRNHLERFGIAPQKADVRVVEKIADGWRLETDRGPLLANAVIIATGTQPVPLELSGAAELEHRGVFYEVRHVVPFLESMSPRTSGLQRGEKAPRPRLSHWDECLIIGGGEASLDYALTLAGRNIQAAIYVRRDRLKARGRLVEIVRKSANIRVVFSHQPVQISQTDRGIAVEFETPRGRVVEVASAVLGAIGRRRNLNKVLKGLDVYPVRTVSTRFPGLYIAGDARVGSLGQIGMAVGDGLAASMAAVTWLEPM